MSNEPKVCEHGSLRRSCLLCEFTDEIAALRAENEALKGEVDHQKSRADGWNVAWHERYTGALAAEAALERMKCCDAPGPVIGCDCLRCMEANTRTAILAKHAAEADLAALRGEAQILCDAAGEILVGYPITQTRNRLLNSSKRLAALLKRVGG